ncbi:YidB family protein [Teichococcus wenyumeiae]|nr:YidB family protein [Pseudoroseomonas wenyumeiae]
MSGFFSGRSGGGLAGGLPNGVKLAAIAFLIHQLMKQRGAEAQTPGGVAQHPAGAQHQGGGGLGEILGSLLGGAGGGGTTGGTAGGGLGGLLGGGGAGGLGGLLGGLPGMLGGMRGRGLSQQVDSWVSPNENQPVSAQDLERHFDPQELDEAAREAGTDRASLLEELRQVLPQFVDRMTPNGTLPQPGAEPQGGGGNGDLGNVMNDILRGKR